MRYWAVLRKDKAFGHLTKKGAQTLVEEFKQEFKGTEFVVAQVATEATLPITSEMPENDRLDAIGDELLQTLGKNKLLLISLAVNPANYENVKGSFSVEISDGEQQVSGVGVRLSDAIGAARRALNIKTIQPVQLTREQIEAAREPETPKPKISLAGLKLKKS